jgi:hypothetical protein
MLQLVALPVVGSAHPENFLKYVKQSFVSALKVGWGGLSSPGRKFLAPPLLRSNFIQHRYLTKILYYSAVKNYRITYSSPVVVVCSFSASFNFRWKESLHDYMYLSMLYTVIKSDSSMLILSSRKQMFAEIG